MSGAEAALTVWVRCGPKRSTDHSASAHDALPCLGPHRSLRGAGYPTHCGSRTPVTGRGVPAGPAITITRSSPATRARHRCLWEGSLVARFPRSSMAASLRPLRALRSMRVCARSRSAPSSKSAALGCCGALVHSARLRPRRIRHPDSQRVFRARGGLAAYTSSARGRHVTKRSRDHPPGGRGLAACRPRKASPVQLLEQQAHVGFKPNKQTNSARSCGSAQLSSLLNSAQSACLTQSASLCHVSLSSLHMAHSVPLSA